jgi:hypothetical protein
VKFWCTFSPVIVLLQTFSQRITAELDSKFSLTKILEQNHYAFWLTNIQVFISVSPCGYFILWVIIPLYFIIHMSQVLSLGACFFCFLMGGLNSGLHACKAGTLNTWAIPPVHFSLFILDTESFELFALAGLELQSSYFSSQAARITGIITSMLLSLGAFSVDSWVPLTWPYLCEGLLNTFWYYKLFHLILCFSCSNPATSHFSKEPWFFLLDNSIRSQEWSTVCACCF